MVTVMPFQVREMEIFLSSGLQSRMLFSAAAMSIFRRLSPMRNGRSARISLTVTFLPPRTSMVRTARRGELARKRDADPYAHDAPAQMLAASTSHSARRAQRWLRSCLNRERTETRLL